MSVREEVPSVAQNKKMAASSDSKRVGSPRVCMPGTCDDELCVGPGCMARLPAGTFFDRQIQRRLTPKNVELVGDQALMVVDKAYHDAVKREEKPPCFPDWQKHVAAKEGADYPWPKKLMMAHAADVVAIPVVIPILRGRLSEILTNTIERKENVFLVDPIGTSEILRGDVVEGMGAPRALVTGAVINSLNVMTATPSLAEFYMSSTFVSGPKPSLAKAFAQRGSCMTTSRHRRPCNNTTTVLSKSGPVGDTNGRPEATVAQNNTALNDPYLARLCYTRPGELDPSAFEQYARESTAFAGTLLRIPVPDSSSGDHANSPHWLAQWIVLTYFSLFEEDIKKYLEAPEHTEAWRLFAFANMTAGGTTTPAAIEPRVYQLLYTGGASMAPQYHFIVRKEFFLGFVEAFTRRVPLDTLFADITGVGLSTSVQMDLKTANKWKLEIKEAKIPDNLISITVHATIYIQPLNGTLIQYRPSESSVSSFSSSSSSSSSSSARTDDDDPYAAFGITPTKPITYIGDRRMVDGKAGMALKPTPRTGSVRN